VLFPPALLPGIALGTMWTGQQRYRLFLVVLQSLVLASHSNNRALNQHALLQVRIFLEYTTSVLIPSKFADASFFPLQWVLNVDEILFQDSPPNPGSDSSREARTTLDERTLSVSWNTSNHGGDTWIGSADYSLLLPLCVEERRSTRPLLIRLSERDSVTGNLRFLSQQLAHLPRSKPSRDADSSDDKSYTWTPHTVVEVRARAYLPDIWNDKYNERRSMPWLHCIFDLKANGSSCWGRFFRICVVFGALFALIPQVKRRFAHGQLPEHASLKAPAEEVTEDAVANNHEQNSLSSGDGDLRDTESWSSAFFALRRDVRDSHNSEESDSEDDQQILERPPSMERRLICPYIANGMPFSEAIDRINEQYERSETLNSSHEGSVMGTPKGVLLNSVPPIGRGIVDNIEAISQHNYRQSGKLHSFHEGIVTQAATGKIIPSNLRCSHYAVEIIDSPQKIILRNSRCSPLRMEAIDPDIETLYAGVGKAADSSLHRVTVVGVTDRGSSPAASVASSLLRPVAADMSGTVLTEHISCSSSSSDSEAPHVMLGLGVRSDNMDNLAGRNEAVIEGKLNTRHQRGDSFLSGNTLTDQQPLDMLGGDGLVNDLLCKRDNAGLVLQIEPSAFPTAHQSDPLVLIHPNSSILEQKESLSAQTLQAAETLQVNEQICSVRNRVEGSDLGIHNPYEDGAPVAGPSPDKSSAVECASHDLVSISGSVTQAHSEIGPFSEVQDSHLLLPDTAPAGASNDCVSPDMATESIAVRTVMVDSVLGASTNSSKKGVSLYNSTADVVDHVPCPQYPNDGRNEKSCGAQRSNDMDCLPVEIASKRGFKRDRESFDKAGAGKLLHNSASTDCLPPDYIAFDRRTNNNGDMSTIGCSSASISAQNLQLTCQTSPSSQDEKMLHKETASQHLDTRKISSSPIGGNTICNESFESTETEQMGQDVDRPLSSAFQADHRDLEVQSPYTSTLPPDTECSEEESRKENKVCADELIRCVQDRLNRIREGSGIKPKNLNELDIGLLHQEEMTFQILKTSQSAPGGSDLVSSIRSPVVLSQIDEPLCKESGTNESRFQKLSGSDGEDMIHNSTQKREQDSTKFRENCDDTSGECYTNKILAQSATIRSVVGAEILPDFTPSTALLSASEAMKDVLWEFDGDGSKGNPFALREVDEPRDYKTTRLRNQKASNPARRGRNARKRSDDIRVEEKDMVFISPVVAKPAYSLVQRKLRSSNKLPRELMILETPVLTGTKSPVRRDREPRTQDDREVLEAALSPVRLKLDQEKDATTRRITVGKSADIARSCDREGAPCLNYGSIKKRTLSSPVDDPFHFTDDDEEDGHSSKRCRISGKQGD